MTSLKRMLRFRSLLAVALMLWCAGTGCMLVSYARAMSEKPSAGPADQTAGSSMSMDAHACCKAKHRSAKTAAKAAKVTAGSNEFEVLTFPVTPTQSGVMSCCPLTSGSIVVGSRSQSNDRATVLQNVDASPLLISKSDHSPLAIPLRLPSRADSYLLDCAFLI